MPSPGRRTRGAFDFWPGFVDALSTLLIVIIFLILVFVLAQFFLGQALSGRESALQKLTDQIAQMADILALERGNNTELRQTISQLTADLQASATAREAAQAKLATTINERDALTQRLNDTTAKLAELQALTEQTQRGLEDANRIIAADRNKLELQLKQLAQLERDIEALKQVRAQLEKQVADAASLLQARDIDLTAARDRSAALEARLSTAEERTALAQRDIAQRDIRLAELLARGDLASAEIQREKQLGADAHRQVELLNQQLTALRQQLAAIQTALDISETKAKQQDIQIVDLGRRLNLALASKVEELARYRSEFFGRLREILGDRPDVRIVGDRFIFQSEVLFAPGSAELGDAGRAQVERVAQSLRELISRMPTDLSWILRVDGHTDHVPIKTAQFPSNWELSTARAIAVVKFMIDQGIPADRLAATGFGEHQPLDPREDDAAKRRNRRIELKLTER